MKKILSIFTTITLCVCSLFAVSGIDSQIKDNSGEYVFYKDNSFSRESYLGILYYDDSTYQIKYFAPRNDEQFLPEKEIALLITVNKDVDYWEMTGEKIISTILPNDEDVDIVNYLHDILYDFYAKRAKSDGASSYVDDYPQFGGRVTISFNPIIPIFNVESIISVEKPEEPALKVVSFGQMKNSEDKSFENFKGFPVQKEVKRNSKKSPRAKKQTLSYENHFVKADENWTSALDNIWLNNDEGMITLSSIPKFTEDDSLNRKYIFRKLLQSNNSSFVDLDLSKYNLEEKPNYEIYTETYQPETNKWIVNYKLLTPKEDGSFDYFCLTVFKDSFYEKYDYYNKIIKSYK